MVEPGACAALISVVDAALTDLAPYLRRAHERYPRQALLMTEFGAEASRSGPADVKQTYAFQTSYIQRTLAIADCFA